MSHELKMIDIIIGKMMKFVAACARVTKNKFCSKYVAITGLNFSNDSGIGVLGISMSINS